MDSKKDFSCAKIFKVVYKNLVPRVVRSRIKKILRFIDRYTFKTGIRKQFFNTHGYELNLKQPRSLSEKIIWKKLYDRNPLIPLTIDKYRAREYIENKLGKRLAEEHLIPLLHVVEDPENIPFDAISDECILKPNHGVYRYIIIEKDAADKRYTIDDGRQKYILADSIDTRDKVISVCNTWLNKVFCTSKHEWGYTKIKPLLVIEKLLKYNGKIPDDYKFFMFHGKCKMINVCTDRRIGLKIGYLDQEWNLIPVARSDCPSIDAKIEKPEVLEKMISLAEKLSEDFDFARIDFYLAGNQIYCGEITHYPSSGLIKFTPTEFDFEIGKHWHIKGKSEKLKLV